MLFNFSYVLPRHLAGCAHPGRQGSLLENLRSLKEDHGVTALISLTEVPLDATEVERLGIRYHHCPTPDFGVPSMEVLARGVAFACAEIARQGNVTAHCGAGCGRTGTFLACCLVARGYSGLEAVSETREARPCSIETLEQEEFVLQWEQWLARHPHILEGGSSS